MMKYIKNRRQNRISEKTSVPSGIEKARKRIYRQAALTVLTILLTVLILFAMTSAWYTNVVQTSGLTFEAESWGFDGQITVGDEAIPAAPGDSGIIDLTVANAGDSVSAISVNVSKSAMAEEMRQRLFFYVDTRVIRNGEVMDRVYLNRYEGYTYNVFNNSQLTLTEEIGNAPVIKWEWVYDVLGYYVIGQPYDVSAAVENETEDTESTDGTDTSNTSDSVKMEIREYLRPITYDFDAATMVVNTDGETVTLELETVDGVQTPEQFLAELFKADGYTGEEVKAPVYGNYYPVDVDENGHGVYAYLCNYAEIQTATQYDTELGELARQKASGVDLGDDEALLRHTATLQLAAQKEESTVIALATMGALQDAIMLGTADVIRLTGDVVVPEETTLEIPTNRRVTVDLNGHKLVNMYGTAITAQPGSSLTLTNGMLQQDTDVTDAGTTYGIRAIGAEVVMSDVMIEDFQIGIYGGDNAAENQMDSRIHIMDSEITVDNCAVFLSGNGLVSTQKSMLIIERSTLSSHNMVISGNGDSSGNGRWGTDIQIINSKILGTETEGSDLRSVGIYQPQKNSTLMIKDSVVDGCTGIALKGGSVQIVDSRIIGHGIYEAPSMEDSGFTNTGDAIYVETGYSYEIQLRISGDETSLEHVAAAENTEEGSRSLRVFEANSPYVLVEIEGGVYDESLTDTWLAEHCTQEEISEGDDQGRIRVVKTVPAEEATEEQSDETTEATQTE